MSLPDPSMLKCNQILNSVVPFDKMDRKSYFILVLKQDGLKIIKLEQVKISFHDAGTAVCRAIVKVI